MFGLGNKKTELKEEKGEDNNTEPKKTFARTKDGRIGYFINQDKEPVKPMVDWTLQIVDEYHEDADVIFKTKIPTNFEVLTCAPKAKEKPESEAS